MGMIKPNNTHHQSSEQDGKIDLISKITDKSYTSYLKTVVKSSRKRSYKNSAQNNISNILIVGAGGIGCELIKLLIFYSKNITIIDYDTIELTNLNRQFIFTQKDINKSKSETIGQKYKINYLDKNIFDLNINFYKKFSVIFGCLDNAKARSYLNKMCMFLKIPYIDGGSSGYLGQAMLFLDGFECYDCVPTNEETFPVCTIHGVPKNYENVIYWAKTVFIEYLDKNRNASLDDLMNVIEFNPKNVEEEDKNNDQENINLFNKDIEKYEENLKSIDQVNHENIHLINSEDMKLMNVVPNFINNKSMSSKKIFKNYNAIKNELFDLFIQIKNRTSIEYSRDDKLILRIIYIASVIRSSVFNIEYKNFFETEKMITKIIPSICTTNSIVASFMILIYENLQKDETIKCMKRLKKEKVKGGEIESEINSDKNIIKKSNNELSILIANLKSRGFEVFENISKEYKNTNNFFISKSRIISKFKICQSRKNCQTCNTIKIILESPKVKISDIIDYFGCNYIFQDDLLLYGDGFEEHKNDFLDFNHFYTLNGNLKIYLYLTESSKQRIFL
ncbi:Ubiquitin-activating enzyme E1-like [Dictyocoela muelleri]|nr:Ubiquitin-activating enzyme E1-like [Dictyocoela muelleri]